MNIKLILGSLAIVTGLSACSDEMNYKEYTSYDKDYVFKNFNNTNGFVSNIYSWLDYDLGMFGSGMFASACDEAEHAWRSSEVNDFTNGAWNAANAKANWWSEAYTAIRACNFYLRECETADFSDYKFNQEYTSEMKRFNRYKYEVRFLRAYFYFRQARQFGAVPFSTTVMTEEEANTLSQTPAQDIFKFVSDECDAIVNQLPASYSTLGDDKAANETGRVNKLAVLALKARTKLYAASPLFNTDNNKELWKEAAEANKAVLDSCSKYGVALGKYSALWGSDNWQNKEMIFVRRIGDLNWVESNNFPIGVEGGNSGNCPTQNLVDAYDMKASGLPIDEAGSGYNPDKPYEGRDPRFAMTIAKNGDEGWPSYNPHELQTYYGGLNGEPIAGATPTGYYLKKYLDASVNVSSTNSNTKRHSWITYRLGEFYLNYAEAVFRYLGSADATSSEFPMSAREAVNVIRNREDVKMPGFPEGMTNSEFWKRYENERMVELAFEDHRFWDLRRWKEGDKLKSIVEMHITKNSDGTFSYTRKTVQRHWDDKMYFFPIPLSEILKNGNLKQNPGW